MTKLQPYKLIKEMYINYVFILRNHCEFISLLNLWNIQINIIAIIEFNIVFATLK